MREKTQTLVFELLKAFYQRELLLQQNLSAFLEKGDPFEVYKKFSMTLKRKVMTN